MKHYIDKDKIDEILRNLWKEDDGHNSEHRIYYNKALQEVQCEIDTLEVKEVDDSQNLEKEAAKGKKFSLGFFKSANANDEEFSKAIEDIENGLI